MTYIDISYKTFMAEPEEPSEYLQERRAAAAREREYLSSGYWPQEEEQCSGSD